MPDDFGLTGHERSSSTTLLVAICTYKRPDGLRALLRSLAEQRSADPWRVVIVDNDPSRAAEAVVRDLAGGFPRPITYVPEPSGHIVTARNRALDEASPREAVLFVDDDEVPQPGWLEAFVRAHHAAPRDVLTGPVRPHLEGLAPAWAPDLWFFIRQEHEDGSPVGMTGGGNALLPAALHAGLGLRFAQALDGVGAEDTELFMRWQASGGRLRWVSEAVVLEDVPVSRTRLRYAFDRSRASAYGYARITVTGPRTWLPRTLRVPVRATQGLGLLLWGGIRRDPVVRARALVHLGQSWGTLQAVAGYRQRAGSKRGRVDARPA